MMYKQSLVHRPSKIFSTLVSLMTRLLAFTSLIVMILSLSTVSASFCHEDDGYGYCEECYREYCYCCCEFDDDCCEHMAALHGASFGPIAFYFKRDRVSGSRQEGGLYGIYVQYERIQPSAFYWGIDYYFAVGELNGTGSFGDALTSDFKEWEVEMHAGYTWPLFCMRPILITPFGGLGYYEAENQFVPPSMVSWEYDTNYSFATFGLLVRIGLSCRWVIGVRAKGRYTFHPRCKVKGDPINGTVVQLIENEMHYSVELPIEYACFDDGRDFEVIFAPFYGFRKLGGRENFPADFYTTDYTLLGARLQMLCRF